MKKNIDYKIINLVTEDFNKSIVIYGINDDGFISFIANKINDDIAYRAKEELSCHIISVNPNMACIDLKVDDYFDDEDIEDILRDIIYDNYK